MKKKTKETIINVVAVLLLVGAGAGIINTINNTSEKKEEHICNNYTISDDAIVVGFDYYFTDDNDGIPFNPLSTEVNERYNKAVAKGHNEENPPGGYGSNFVEANFLPEYVCLDVNGLNVGTTYSVSIILSCSNYDLLSEYFDGSISLTGINEEDGTCYGSVEVDSLKINNEKNSCEFKEFNFRKIKLFDATYTYKPENSTEIVFYSKDIPADEYLYLSKIVLEPVESTTKNLRSLNSNTSEEVINYHKDDDETERHIEWGPLS